MDINLIASLIGTRRRAIPLAFDLASALFRRIDLSLEDYHEKIRDLVYRCYAGKRARSGCGKCCNHRQQTAAGT